MFNEKKFKFDIENLKQDLAIEDMYVSFISSTSL